MNCLENENVCSVKKENDSGYYRLHTIWRKDGFFINIASKNGAWCGEMTPNDVSKMSVQLEMEPESYLNFCKESLTCHGGRPGIVYAVENGCFTWKKVEDEDSGIKVKMGSVMLEPTNFVDTIQNLVTAALNCNKSLQDKLIEVTEKKEKILQSKNELLNKLNELIKTKETMETDLYSKFILLINTKKRKIQELEEKLRKTEDAKSEDVKNPYEIDTDNDSEDEIKKFKVGKEKSQTHSDAQTQRSTRKISFSSEMGPEEKRKKNNEGFIREKSETEYKNDFCEPSTSKIDLKKQTSQINMEKAATKDELYDFFYGELS